MDEGDKGILGTGQSPAGTIIEGPLEDYIVISVPVHTTTARCAEIEDMAENQFDKKVLVMTNNVNFLKVVKLTTKEAAKVLTSSEPNIKKLVSWINEGVDE